MGVEIVIKGEGSQIEVEFSGDFRDFADFNRDALTEYVTNFIKKYGEEKEIFELSIYLRKFEATYFGRPLVFCSIAANTEFGLVSVNSTGWGLKQAVRQSLKSVVLDIQKLGERELYGSFAEVSA